MNVLHDKFLNMIEHQICYSVNRNRQCETIWKQILGFMCQWKMIVLFCKILLLILLYFSTIKQLTWYLLVSDEALSERQLLQT